MQTRLALAALFVLLIPVTAVAGPRSPEIGYTPSFNPEHFTLGPATFSVPLYEARSHDKALSLILREARSVMKRCCNAASSNKVYVINGFYRKLRYTYRVENMDISVGRGGSGATGTANVSFSCVLR